MQNQMIYAPGGRVVWPFPSVNGHQTPQSMALMLDKSQHKPTQFDISTVEESPL